MATRFWLQILSISTVNFKMSAYTGADSRTQVFRQFFFIQCSVPKTAPLLCLPIELFYLVGRAILSQLKCQF